MVTSLHVAVTLCNIPFEEGNTATLLWFCLYNVNELYFIHL